VILLGADLPWLVLRAVIDLRLTGAAHNSEVRHGMWPPSLR
jgi:hypothetical protein